MLFLRLRYLRAGLVGLGVAGLLTLLGASGGQVKSAPATPGPAREVQLASLYERTMPGLAELAAGAMLRDREGFWGNARDGEILDRIGSRPIRKISLNRGGSSLSFRLELADGWSAAFKPEQIHTQTVPRKEIAAYRINRLLGLSRVPPATCRVLSLREIYTHMDRTQRHLFFRVQKEARFQRAGNLAGEVSYWIPEVRYVPIDRWKARKQWAEWLKAYKALPGEHAALTAQISVMLIFDFLINNPDRFSGNNTLGTPDSRFLYFMDNTYSFHPAPRAGAMARMGLARVQRFSRRFFQRLKALDEPRLRAALGADRSCPWPLLTDEELRAVIARRDHVVQHVNAVVARYGWERTMVFP